MTRAVARAARRLSLVRRSKTGRLAQIEAARARIAGLSMTAPLVGCDAAPPGKTLRLKLENLQPIGSFKIRPIGNAVLSKHARRTQRRHLHHQFGQQRARRGLDGAPSGDCRHRRRARQRAGSEAREAAASGRAHRDARRTMYWWRAIEAGTLDDQEGRLHRRGARPGLLGRRCNDRRRDSRRSGPMSRRSSIPFGGGGLACGIACAVRALKPEVKIIACELASAHPLKSAFDAGAPVQTPHEPGFVSGVGFGSVLPEMWPLRKSHDR